MTDCTIIIPVYNCEPTALRRCLDSVCALKDRTEILIIDDGSTDDTPKLLKEYDEKYSFIHVITQKNRGVSAARNAGIDRAEGTFILFCDADDVVDAGSVRDGIAAMEECGADLGYADFYKTVGDAKETVLLEDLAAGREYLHCMLCQPNRYGAVWGKIYRRQLLEDSRIRFDETLSHAEDTEFLVRVSQKASVVRHLKKPIYNYYIYPASAAKINRDAIRAFRISLEKIREDLAGETETVQRAFYNCCNINLLIMVVNYIFRPGVSFAQGKPVLEELLGQDLFRRSLNEYDRNEMGKANRAVLTALKAGQYRAVYLAAKARQAR